MMDLELGNEACHFPLMPMERRLDPGGAWFKNYRVVGPGFGKIR